MSFDISGTLAPDSSQINAEDLLSGPVTVTVRDVSKGTPEQPININLVEYPDRAYRPSKTMRRLIVAAWGADAAQYAGRRLTLYRNPDIKFGRETVGGIEVSAMSDILKPVTVPLTVSRGKRRTFKVDVLPDAPAPRDWAAEIAAADMDGLRALWPVAPDAHKPAITEKVAALKESGADA